ncbi:copper amine oxidase [Rhizodiscina lignyota]|uniref:Amine oxidase n=1 Tax=Rhizodiscina lignyota TaxID=1504668 RepID=A0A9P4MC55_9PEZI|nr:copper amine oxidase [Rhizodiscina lignyota]
MTLLGRHAILASSAFLFLFVVLFTFRPVFKLPEHPYQASRPTPDTCHRCSAPRKNIWADLSEGEADELLEYLYSGPNDLNLTRSEKATAWDNHVAFVEVLPPNKTDAIKYLEGTDAPPARWARISVNNGSTEQAGIYQYMVGPLPTTQETIIQPLLYCYNSGRHYVRNPLPNMEDITEWFAATGEELSDIMDDLIPGVRNPSNLPDAPPLMGVTRPAVFNDDGVVVSWAQVHGPGVRFDAWSLNPQGIYCKFEIAGRDKSQWKITQWYYNGEFYNSTQDFRQAWKEPGFKKLPPNHDGKWTAAQPDQQGLASRAEAGPVMVQPAGGRFAVDEREKFVSWMGFEFYLSTMQATALSLWDIKFRGDRVIYEITLQEAFAHYAGADPMQAGMIWLDTLFGMGFNMYELVPGYDCPPYATYLSTSFQQKDKTVFRNNSICIFEYTADHPLQRHTTPRQTTISRNTYLVVRSVSTVGNYDYTIDYQFYLDGTIEVKLRASGYIFGAYHPQNSKAKRDILQYTYGYQVHDQVATSMHDHGISFKADVDVAGSANSMVKLDIAPYTHQYDFDSDPRNTMRLKQSTLEKEQGFNWPPNANAMYIILNNDTTNSWGEKRGYRITPGTGMGIPPHLTVKDSTAMGNAAKWSDKDLWVLRQKDGERRGASEYNAMEPLDPLIDFSKMVDDEGIVQEDLVVYFTLGTHHISHSGDIPNTLMHTSATSVIFTPHNFHDRDPSRESAQGVRLDLNGAGKGANVTYFGARYEKGVKLDLVSLPISHGKNCQRVRSREC